MTTDPTGGKVKGVFEKLPVRIKARQFRFDTDWSALAAWCSGELRPTTDKGPTILIHTLEGDHEAILTDWIICGVAGEFYPCKSDIFDRTYRQVGDNEPPDEAAALRDELAEEKKRVEELEGLLRKGLRWDWDHPESCMYMSAVPPTPECDCGIGETRARITAALKGAEDAKPEIAPEDAEIERKARAAYTADCILDAFAGVRPRRRKWSTCAESTREKYRAAARAAIDERTMEDG